MKRVVSLIMLVCLLLPAMAQDNAAMAQGQTLPPTVRTHNTYMVGDQVMDKRAYKGYLQNTCPEAYKKFKSAYTTAITGWAFFGTGLVMETAADIGTLCYILQDGNRGSNIDLFVGKYKGLTACSLIGFAFTVTGIVCVSVGYCDMHKAADIYNVQTQQKPSGVTLSLKPTTDGIGLALNF